MGRILIVEDDLEIRNLLGLALEMEEHECQLASTAEEALEVQRVQPADAIVLDFMMPQMNGGEFCTQLRSRNDLTPVLILSADKEIARRAQRCGADRIMKKPFEMDEFLETVNGLVRQSRPEVAPA